MERPTVALAAALGVREVHDQDSESVPTHGESGRRRRRGTPRRGPVLPPLAGEPIDFPLVESGNVLLAMTREALSAHLPRVSQTPIALSLVDSTYVKEPPKGSYAVSATATAKEEFDLPMAANIVLLGAFAAISKAITLDSVCEVVSRSGTKSIDQNLAALRGGYALGEAARKV